MTSGRVPDGDYLARVERLAPLIEACAADGDRERRLPARLVSALTEAGMFRLLLPRSLGGAELPPAAFVRVIEGVSRADGSTAWVLCQLSGCSMSAAYLEPAVARAIFTVEPQGILAWGSGPAGQAVATDGGYRVTGSWGFASGGRHATWLGSHTPILEADGTPRRRGGGAEVRTMLYPATQATMTDVWHVIGLRGTGSDTYAVTDLFVPREHTVNRDDPAERQEPGPLYCFPTGSMYASGFAGVAMGLAGSMLDAMIALAMEKTPRGFKHKLRDSAVVQSGVARAEARLGSARAYLLSVLEEIWHDVGQTGASLGIDERVRIRLAATSAIHQAMAVADWTYHTAGATAIFEGSAFERRFRDIHAVSQQVQGRAAHYETVGRHRLGLEPDSTYL